MNLAMNIQETEAAFTENSIFHFPKWKMTFHFWKEKGNFPYFHFWKEKGNFSYFQKWKKDYIYIFPFPEKWKTTHRGKAI